MKQALLDLLSVFATATAANVRDEEAVRLADVKVLYGRLHSIH